MGAPSASRTFRIGRSPDCDVVLADDSVSRRHAELVVTAQGELYLSDCHSTHGTSLVERGTGRPIKQEVVRPDATLRFGDVTTTRMACAEAGAAAERNFLAALAAACYAHYDRDALVLRDAEQDQLARFEGVLEGR